MGLPQVLLHRFDVDAFVDAALRHQATATFFVPGMVTRLADALERSGRTVVPPLRRLLYGGAPIALDDLVRAVERIGPVLIQVYGRFEGGWPLAVLGVHDHARIAAGDTALAASCGRPVDRVELRVRSVPGQPPGRGELSVRGDTVVAEYADPDGWCALGDVAWLDQAGYLYLGGRLDGMINTGSYHVYPREVEEAIAAVPGVKGRWSAANPTPPGAKQSPPTSSPKTRRPANNSPIGSATPWKPAWPATNCPSGSTWSAPSTCHRQGRPTARNLPHHEDDIAPCATRSSGPSVSATRDSTGTTLATTNPTTP
jgi:acyl-CoA synthetase (AMP-forming)/AMP-acid ligase II